MNHSNETCFECDAPAEHQHHVVPKSRGGTRTVPLCGPCHAKAHHRAKNMAARELTRQALAEAKARGNRAGQVPFGSRIDPAAPDRSKKSGAPCRLVPHPDEARALALIHHLAAAGWSRRRIARELDHRKVPTKSGRPWKHSTVHDILKRAAADGQA